MGVWSHYFRERPPSRQAARNLGTGSSLARRVDLLLRYIDLHRRTQLADLSERGSAKVRMRIVSNTSGWLTALGLLNGEPLGHGSNVDLRVQGPPGCHYPTPGQLRC